MSRRATKSRSSLVFWPMSAPVWGSTVAVGSMTAISAAAGPATLSTSGSVRDEGLRNARKPNMLEMEGLGAL